jgi:hypothetical protein
MLPLPIAAPAASTATAAAHIPLYLYPFLNTGSRSKPFEYLRLTSLGVIGALVKVRSARVYCGRLFARSLLLRCF